MIFQVVMAAPRDPTSPKYQHHLSEIKVGSHVEFVVECKYVFTFLILYHLLERATKKLPISHAEIVLFVLVLFNFVLISTRQVSARISLCDQHV